MFCKRFLFIIGSLSLLSGPLAMADETRTPSDQDSPTLVLSVVLDPINGGFNPIFAGFRLMANVLQGDNPCFADAYIVRLHVTQIEDAEVVEAVKSLTTNVRCPLYYAPVYRDYVTDIRFDRQRVHRIIIKNYRAWGVDHVIPIPR